MATVQWRSLDNGYAIRGTFPDQETLHALRFVMSQEQDVKAFPLVIADPPYGNIVTEDWDKIESDDKVFCDWMVGWTKTLETFLFKGGALYVWGGVGKPLFRPFYRYLVAVEEQTQFRLANHITWSKRRAYGVQNNYLFTREELAFFIKGDPKLPAKFNIPLLDTKRGYAGYNAKYPAKSEYFRRTNVWMDITEILRGKVHPTQKPIRVMEIPIETHTDSGDWVFDPFGGSGCTALAAQKLGRKFVIIEQDKAIFDAMVNRIEKAATDPGHADTGDATTSPIPEDVTGAEP